VSMKRHAPCQILWNVEHSVFSQHKTLLQNTNQTPAYDHNGTRVSIMKPRRAIHSNKEVSLYPQLAPIMTLEAFMMA
jgi:hypothetical protein